VPSSCLQVLAEISLYRVSRGLDCRMLVFLDGHIFCSARARNVPGLGCRLTTPATYTGWSLRPKVRTERTPGRWCAKDAPHAATGILTDVYPGFRPARAHPRSSMSVRSPFMASRRASASSRPSIVARNNPMGTRKCQFRRNDGGKKRILNPRRRRPCPGSFLTGVPWKDLCRLSAGAESTMR